MLISEIGITNFRCYRETHKVPLSTTPTSNLVVIYGENMRGKTTIMQAIRWGLYGEVRDRDDNVVAIFDPDEKEQLLSLGAASDGDYRMQVEIAFTHEGGEYLLRRQADRKGLALGDPSGDEDFAVGVSLSRNGNQVAEMSISTVIQSILSDDVSRFFLFDGEMLQEYERLLKSPDKEAATVKEAIEKILGLPALEVWRDLDEEATKVEKRLNTALRKKAKQQDLVEQASRLENEVRGIRRDIQVMERDLSERRIEASESELAVKKIQAFEQQVTEKALLESQIDAQQDILVSNEQAVRALLAEHWWLPVSSLAEERVVSLGNDVLGATAEIEEQTRVGDAVASLKAGECRLCGQEVGDISRTKLRAKVDAGASSRSEERISSLVELVRRQQIYERFRAGDARAELLVRQENIDQARITSADLESKISLIESVIAGKAQGEMADKVDRWTRLANDVKRLEQQLKDKRLELADKESEHGSVQRQLNGLPDADPTLGLLARAYRELSLIFKSAVQEFRDELRHKVGEDASTIFRELTTESSYSGLEINDQYGLALLDRDGKPVPGRSAGAEQIVALSLIGGLNKAAVREGPVVMDTNFGRLDMGHRERVLRFLPHLGPQVVILVHSGELPRDQELASVGLTVARRLQVKRLTETQSEIEVLA